MSDPQDPGLPGGTGDDRWAKWDQWRTGELHLSDPATVIPEPGLGDPGTLTAVPWRAREGFVVFFLHILLTAVLALFPAIGFTDPDWLGIVTVLLSQIALLTVLYLWVRMRYGVGFRSLGYRGLTWGNVRAGLAVGALGIGVSLVVGIVIQILFQSFTGDPAPEPVQIPLQDEPTSGLLLLIGLMVVLFAPIAEETFFRGFVFAGLRRWARAGPSVAISAFVFSIVHLDPTSWEAFRASLLVILLPIFLLGVLLATVVERRRSLVPAIVAHLVFNLFGFSALFLV